MDDWTAQMNCVLLTVVKARKGLPPAKLAELVTDKNRLAKQFRESYGTDATAAPHQEIEPMLHKIRDRWMAETA